MGQEIRISEEQINNFLVGKDPQTGIIGIECSYNDAEASIIYRTSDGKKKIKKDDFKPFLWAKTSGAKRLYLDDHGRQNREKLKKKMDDYGIQVKKLNIYTDNGTTVPRLENGYKLMFTATKPMSFVNFLKFFRIGGVDTYDGSKDFLQVSPVEQYMMRTGKRFFKGFEDYDELERFEFDLETGGLNPYVHRISQIGIRNNRGYEKILHVDGDTEIEKDENELAAIDEYFKIVSELKPDVITGQNVENFDWEFFIVRCEVLGTTIAEVSGKYFREPLYKSKKKTVLKLGGEMEYFNKTNLWGFNLTDSLHAIRRAQAIDSNMKKADLKYVTKYSKLNKPNRVYVPGDKIEKIYRDVDNQFAFNDKDGKWYVITEKHGLDEGYEIKTGRYIVERYLLDDLYETDKVELRYNQSNFLLGKLLPTTFSRVCTMGTAGIWKLIMMAWSFENNLAIPDFDLARRFTGGLSRLLKVGYVPNVVKLDYNSLYPAVILTWLIEPNHDISNVMLSLLNYILTEREKFKELKALAGAKIKKLKKELSLLEVNSPEWIETKKEIKKWENEKNANDKKQLPLKIIANSFFGSFGAPNLFPWGDVTCAEKTTCVGRQALRLMIKWFSDRGYSPIVGDSFLFDTPIFIKYDNNNLIDIVTIKDVIDSNEIKIDLLGREYDYSEKGFKVLSRNGWININYVYRHKTNKKIHRISDGETTIDVTSDHSLFDYKKEKILSKDINEDTKLEYYKGSINIENILEVSDDKAMSLGYDLGNDCNKNNDRIPIEIINNTIEKQRLFFNGFIKGNNGKEIDINNRSKVCLSGILFLKNRLKNIS